MDEKKIIIGSLNDFSKYSFIKLIMIFGYDIAKYLREKVHEMGICLNDEIKEYYIGIDELGFYKKCSDTLRCHGIKNLGELLEVSESDLKKIRGLSNSNSTTIMNRIHELGYVFNFEKEDIKDIMYTDSYESIHNHLMLRHDSATNLLDSINKELEILEKDRLV